MEISKNNYIRKFGTEVTFNIEIDPLPCSEMNYYKESLLAAEEIYSQREGKFYIMYSGGIDSEFALSLFLEKKMNVIPVIIKFKDDLNIHDVVNALEFCNSKNLTPLIIDIDFKEFVTSGKIIEWVNKIRSSAFQRAATAYATTKLDGTIICGEGEPHLHRDKNTGKWNVCILEHDYAIVNFFKEQGILGNPHFLRYRPEMYRAFLKDPWMQDLAADRIIGKKTSESSKWYVYNRDSGYNLKKRKKYHGYELILRSNLINHPNFQEVIKKKETQWNGFWVEDYYTFMNRPCI